MEDRRRYQRYGATSDKHFEIKRNDADASPGAIRNMSRGGICFYSKRYLDANNEYPLELALAGKSRMIPCAVRVMWSHPAAGEYAYGAKFVRIKPEDKFELMDALYVDWRKTVVSKEAV